MHSLPTVVAIVCALLTAAAMAYSLLALLGARSFAHAAKKMAAVEFAPAVTILKPVKGVDPRMYAGFVSHCQQQYAGEYELVFGVSSLSDPAVAEIARLRVEFPEVAITLVECPERLGSNGKISNVVQMMRAAKHEHVVLNDSDIVVSPRYLTSVLRPFADAKVGLVTAPYVGHAAGGLFSKLEALGISTDFMPGMLTARMLEGGIRFGLGSTLATTKTALAKIGGFDALVDQLADDYELGAQLSAAGYNVVLAPEVVETAVPAYSLRGFCEHQLRWSRSVRDSRRAGYLGLGVTYLLPWAALTVLASGAALWAIALFTMALLLRVTVALTIGVGLLHDTQVLRDMLLLPVRDCFGLFFWLWSYAGDTVVWRGETFRLRNGQLERAS